MHLGFLMVVLIAGKNIFDIRFLFYQAEADIPGMYKLCYCISGKTTAQFEIPFEFTVFLMG